MLTFAEFQERVLEETIKGVDEIRWINFTTKKHSGANDTTLYQAQYDWNGGTQIINYTLDKQFYAGFNGQIGSDPDLSQALKNMEAATQRWLESQSFYGVSSM